MSSDKKFGLLRRVLRAIGLSNEKVDDAVDFIDDLLTGEDTSRAAISRAPEFPYHLRDHFLSAAELSFYQVLRTVIGDHAIINTKVALADLFWVKSPEDQSRFRIYTNKIDRKHVDFLLCDSATMQPLIGIELDDKSHQPADRQERDAFVDQVFAAAKLPLLHVSAKRAYSITELAAKLAPYLTSAPQPTPLVVPIPTSTAIRIPPKNATKLVSAPETPQCPKCGSEMVLRTAKNGVNVGSKFWGCTTFPDCRGMLPYTSEKT